MCYSKPTHGIRLRAKFPLDRFIPSPSGGEKKLNFCHFFGLRHLVVSPVGSNLRKLNTGAQLQTFPYPMASKSFFVLQRLHGEIGRTNSDVRKRDEQTDRQTNRQKTQPFWPPRRRVKSDPHQTWWGSCQKSLYFTVGVSIPKIVPSHGWI